MIKEAIDRILDLGKPNITSINGEDFSDKALRRIDKELRAGDCIKMNTLVGLVDYIKGNEDLKGGKYIVHIVSPTMVRLISSLDADREREMLACAEAELPEFRFNHPIGHEEFLIGVQAKFVDDGDTDKATVLRFAGTVKNGSVTELGDDGVSQQATVKRGVASLTNEKVPSPCKLAPYRTFTEVAQPVSSFVFRMGEDERNGGVTCALYEADGGAWKAAAKANIKAYLTERLADKANILIVS